MCPDARSPSTAVVLYLLPPDHHGLQERFLANVANRKPGIPDGIWRAVRESARIPDAHGADSVSVGGYPIGTCGD